MRLASLFASVLVVGCVASPDVEVDGEHDDVMIDNGKGDSGGIREGSPEAKLILIYANGMPEQQMVEWMNIAPITAKNIVEYREQSFGPEDDQYFDTLAELDQVLFVGPIAFQRFLEFGGANIVGNPGDPWTPDNLYEVFGCPSLGPREYGQILPHDGTSVVRPYSWQLVSRHRECAGDCSDWKDAPLSFESDATPAIYPAPTKGTVELERTASGEFRLHLDSPTSPIGFTCTTNFDAWADVKCTPHAHGDTGHLRLPDRFDGTFYDLKGYVCFDGRFHVTSRNYEDQVAIWGWL